MFKRKTFKISIEENEKRFENLYQPKRYRWMKYIVIPAMIGFILLLILINVDFSGKQILITTTNELDGTTVGKLKSEATALSIEFKSRPRSSYNIISQAYVTMLQPVYCKVQDGDPCNIKCANGNVKFLVEDLEEFQEKCDDDLVVNLNNCSFPYQQLTSVNFNSKYFNLKSLEISDCDFIEIVTGAFQIKSMERLKTLSLRTKEFRELTDKSFRGLSALKELNFTNVESVLSLNKFFGFKFLQPIAKTLEHVSLCQQSDRRVYDPFNWLNGTETYSSAIHANLSGNNFANTLSRETFSNLQAVRQLILANSSITTLPTNTFADVVDSLDYLDLSLNSLRNLKVSGLLSTHKSGLHLELYGNPWSCSCENLELITALKAGDFTYDQEPLCATPPDLKDKLLKEVELKCGDEEPTITIEPPLTKPFSTPTPDPVETPNTTQNSTISTTVTTTTPTLPDEKSTPSTSSSSPTLAPEETPNTSINSTYSTTATTMIPSMPDEESTPSIISSSPTPDLEETPNASLNSTISTTLSTATASQDLSSMPTPTLAPDPAKCIELTCRRLPNGSSNFNILVRNYDDRFIIQQTSSFSITISILNNVQHHNLTYFSTNNSTCFKTIRIHQNSPYDSTPSSLSVIHINDLLSNETYIFCLVPMTELNTSPFNCQSHYMGSEIYKDSEAWLQINDQTWFLTVIIFAMAFAICLGMLSIYWLLRWRPTWLRGCKRIIRMDDSTSIKVYLLPNLDRKSSNDSFNDFENFHDSRPNSTFLFHSEDYLTYYKSLQEANRSRKIQTVSSLMPPKDPAPTIAQNRNDNNSVQSKIPANEMEEKYDVVENGNHYQSVDYYEHLF